MERREHQRSENSHRSKDSYHKRRYDRSHDRERRRERTDNRDMKNRRHEPDYRRRDNGERYSSSRDYGRRGSFDLETRGRDRGQGSRKGFGRGRWKDGNQGRRNERIYLEERNDNEEEDEEYLRKREEVLKKRREEEEDYIAEPAPDMLEELGLPLTFGPTRKPIIVEEDDFCYKKENHRMERDSRRRDFNSCRENYDNRKRDRDSRHRTTHERDDRHRRRGDRERRRDDKIDDLEKENLLQLRRRPWDHSDENGKRRRQYEVTHRPGIPTEEEMHHESQTVNGDFSGEFEILSEVESENTGEEEEEEEEGRLQDP